MKYMNISTLDFHSGDQSLNPTEVNSFFFEKLCLKRTKIQKGPFLKKYGNGSFDASTICDKDQ